MRDDLEYTPEELMEEIAENLRRDRIEKGEYTTKDIADILGVSRNTAQQYRADGKLDEWFDYRECMITRSKGYAYSPKYELTEENIQKIKDALNANHIRDDEYSTRDLAEILNVSLNTITKWVSDGKLDEYFDYRKCMEGWAFTPKDDFKTLTD